MPDQGGDNSTPEINKAVTTLVPPLEVMNLTPDILWLILQADRPLYEDDGRSILMCGFTNQDGQFQNIALHSPHRALQTRVLTTTFAN